MPQTIRSVDPSSPGRSASFPHFVRIRDQVGVAAGSESLPVPSDDDYLYLEVEVPGHDDLEVDISIWDGRAVIRIGR